MGIDQVVVRASPGNASTEAALALRPLLRRIGPSEVYAGSLDPALVGEVRPLAEYPACRGPGAESPLVYHASVGDPDVLSFLLERREPVVLIYQDVAPAESLAVLDPQGAQHLALGRAQLAVLRGRVALALADSVLAAEQLVLLGYRDVRVCPFPVDLGPLQDAEPHPPTWHHLQTQLEGPLLLFVGGFLPHERLDLLLEAYHAVVTYLFPEAHLALVGPAGLPVYRDVIQELVWELGLDRAWVAGGPSREELAAYYRSACFFATVSEHPGFSVPPVEAMGFDLPVVARARGGLPETLGGAGLVLPPDAGPLLVAECLAAVLDGAGLRVALAARGQARVAALDPRAAEAALLGHLAEVL